MRIKRAKYLFFYHRNFPKLDLNFILGKTFQEQFEEQIIAVPILYGKEIILNKMQYEKLLSIKENKWSEVKELDEKIISLFDYGILLNKDSTNQKHISFLKREETLSKNKWHIYSALFNFMTKWKDIDVQLSEKNKNDEQDKINHFTKQYGFPLPHFNKVKNTKKTIALKKDDNTNDSFYNLLKARKTSRNFDTTKKMSFDDFSNLIYYSLGVHGINHQYGNDVKILKKCSPSGGGLHPTDGYVLILRVENISPGLYHYDSEENSLKLIKEYKLEEAIEKAYLFSAGQEYTSDSSALIFLSTRYFRNFWKYRKNSAAYLVTIRDGAHICQNFYLLCAKFGVGAFTAAINHSNIEEEIGLDPYEEGISMMIGCGIPCTKTVSKLEPEFEIYNQ